MASQRQIRKRIAAVKNIQQITKAMKVVAATKLRKAQEAVVAARPYDRKMREVLANLAARTRQEGHPLLRTGKGNKTGLVVVTSDKGMCGGFNSNILRRTAHFMAEHEYREVDLILVGKKACEYFKRRSIPALWTKRDFYNDLEYLDGMEIGTFVIETFLTGEYSEILLVYNEFKSAIAQRVVLEQLLPIEPRDLGEKAIITDYLYEPSEEEVLNKLLPLYFNVRIWTMLLESVSAEMGARMTAMESATSNAADMIERLTLIANRVRQATITKELSEIVGGAEALK